MSLLKKIMVGLFSRQWMGLFARKIFNLRREKIRGCFCRVFWCKKSTSRLARNVHHKDTYLRLKTDCNPTSVPRRQGIPELLRVCPPGRNPGGNTRRSGVHRVCRVVFLSLCSRIIIVSHWCATRERQQRPPRRKREIIGARKGQESRHSFSQAFALQEGRLLSLRPLSVGVFSFREF